MNKNDIDKEIRLKELELEKSKMELRSTLIKVWVFCIVALVVVATEILLRDKDNPNSVGYMLLLIDFNLAMWPPLIVKGKKNNEDKSASGKDKAKSGRQ